MLLFRAKPGHHLNTVELGRHGRNRSNVWSYRGFAGFGEGREEALAMHPTVKPVAMIADALLDCTRRRDLVLDPFGGSGTMLLAAQKTNRRARVMEIDPHYCDAELHGQAGDPWNEGGRVRRGHARRDPRMTSPTGNGEYEVGYGKPPKQHRFQKGRSGNPRGRPKGSRNIKTVLESALTKTQPVREDVKVKHLSNIDIIILQLVAKALKGDIKATAMLLQLCAQHDLLGEVTDTTVPADADDRALIESFLSRLNTQGGAS